VAKSDAPIDAAWFRHVPATRVQRWRRTHGQRDRIAVGFTFGE
jgi:hypothetical protein